MNKEVRAPKGHFTGKIGELSVSMMFQRNQIECTPLGTSDFGKDLLCDVFSNSLKDKTSIRTQFSFRTQVKTTEKIETEGYIRKTLKGISLSLSTGLLKIWKQSYYPVVLVAWEISNNIGYWCFPIDQIAECDLSHDTKTITLEVNNLLNDSGVGEIKEHVESYYNNLFRIDKAKYKCDIYPMWMPQFRLFTSMETYELMPQDDRARNLCYSSDMLPAFLSSYNNCNHGGLLSGVEYKDKAQSLEEFLSEINDYIKKVQPSLLENQWVCFILSPIEIISDIDDRVISNFTDWSCLSKLNNDIVSDFNYTFDLGIKYIYSHKRRATSDDHDYFIHNNGNFAVDILTKGFSFFTRKADFQLMSNLYKKSFCIIDISQCNSTQVDAIAEWCYQNNYRFGKFDDDDGKIIISHLVFETGSFGTLLPGAATWKEWDTLDFNSEEFVRKIPYGTPVDTIDKQTILKKYFNQIEEKLSLCSLCYSQALLAEALLHDNRVICFITYLESFNIDDCKIDFEFAEQKLNTICKNYKLYYNLYEDFNDIILEVNPPLTQSTKEIVDGIEIIFNDLVNKLKYKNNQQKNMAYYIKYHLDRWIPEELISKD